jgi:hypothetical protein
MHSGKAGLGKSLANEVARRSVDQGCLRRVRPRERRSRAAGEDEGARVCSSARTTMTTRLRSSSVSLVCSCVKRTRVSQACRNSWSFVRIPRLSHLRRQRVTRKAPSHQVVLAFLAGHTPTYYTGSENGLQRGLVHSGVSNGGRFNGFSSATPRRYMSRTNP